MPDISQTLVPRNSEIDPRLLEGFDPNDSLCNGLEAYPPGSSTDGWDDGSGDWIAPARSRAGNGTIPAESPLDAPAAGVLGIYAAGPVTGGANAPLSLTSPEAFGLKLGPPRIITKNMKYGPRMVRSGPATPDFMKAWQTNNYVMKQAGFDYKPNKKIGKMEVSFWQDPPEEPEGRSTPADLALVKDFLEKLRPGGPWVLTAIVPDGATTTITVNTMDQVEAFVREHNGKRNLYYSVNPTRAAMDKKAAKTDIAAIEYLPSDCDPEPGETSEAAKARYLKQINDGGFETTAGIDSGNGLQLLLRLKERIPLGEPIHTKDRKGRDKIAFAPEDQTKIDDAEGRAAALMRRLGAKAGTQNIDRILRLPGTTNLPTQRSEGKDARSARPSSYGSMTRAIRSMPFRRESPATTGPIRRRRPTRAPRSTGPKSKSRDG
jgi:hypothetical protein